MKAFNKNIYIVGLVLAVSLIFSLVQVGGASSSEMSAQDMAISVMTDVIGLDVAKYKIGLLSNRVDHPDFCGGLVRDSLTYNLEATGSKAHISCTFINKTLTRFYMYPLEGSLIYAQPLSADRLTATKSLLQRYQTYLGDSYLQEACNLLDDVTEIKTMNVTIDNLKLKITENDSHLDLMWWYTLNGVDFPFGLSVDFVNGKLKGFSDNTKFYQIGSTDVKISPEEAIRTTKELAMDYTTLNVSTGNGTYKEVTLNLIDEHIVVELQIGNREPFVFYPLWYVRIYAETSIGGTDGFQAGIWADTGEIAYSQLTGHHGVILPEDSSDHSSIQSQNDISDEVPSNQNLILYLFVAIVAITIATTALYVLKRSK
jgi:hypothetical protein